MCVFFFLMLLSSFVELFYFVCLKIGVSRQKWVMQYPRWHSVDVAKPFIRSTVHVGTVCNVQVNENKKAFGSFIYPFALPKWKRKGKLINLITGKASQMGFVLITSGCLKSASLCSLQLWNLFRAVELACRTDVIFCAFNANWRKRGEREARVALERKGEEKITPVRLPLFKPFRLRTHP